jgi:hypothetical protein
MFTFQMFVFFYVTASMAMSAALSKHYPGIAGWGNFSRGVAWPVTLYEILKGSIEE